MGAIFIAGIGPGSENHITPAVFCCLEEADIILGYRTYLNLVSQIAPHIPRESSGMRQEVQRARRALELARDGKRVCLVSSGDAGIYGMAGVVLELAADGKIDDIPIEVLPGISALNAAAALLGAPLMNDFATVSLSDYLTPLDEILNRVSLAVQAGFVLCLYNPRSHSRHEPFNRTCEILIQNCNPKTPVGIVKAATRPNQQVLLACLEDCFQEAQSNEIVFVVDTFVFSLHFQRL